MIRHTIKKHTNHIFIFIIIIIVSILFAYLYSTTQKSLTNQKYCLDYYKSVNIDINKAIIACNKY